MIYISGPITGNKDARRQFTRTETCLLNRFIHSVINPFYDFEGLEDAIGYSALIDVCSRIAARAKIMVVLPGWENSYGSCSEVLAYLDAGGRIVRLMDPHGLPRWTELIPNDDQESHTDALKNLCWQRIQEGPPM